MSNKIVCNNYTFTGDDISEANCFIGNSLAGEELSIDTLEATLVVESSVFTTSDGNDFHGRDGTTFLCTNPVTGYEYGNVVRLNHKDLLFGKFYFEKANRKSRIEYDFFCVSAIGLLDNMTHYGGIYTQVSAGVIIADIMGDIPYTIAAGVADVPMDGWLPVASRRNNLQQVLFAIGAGIFKDAAGDIAIRYVMSSGPVAISDDRIYMEGSADYKTPCTQVDVTEHAYYALASDKLVTLFNTTAYVLSQPVLFDKPCHDLVATGLTIESSGVNYAIVTGNGSLTGKEYTHTANIMSYSPRVAGAPNVVSVKDATLVSTFNSYNVARRVAQYYSAVSINSIGLVVGDERPATEVSFTDTFDDLVSGYIKSMDINLSTTLKAATDIAIGFLPIGQGNNYTRYTTLTGSGIYTVPEGVERVHAIIVGGGQAGGRGYDGAKSNGTDNAIGGAPGTPGNGGKILIADIEVSQNQQISYSCSNGGIVTESWLPNGEETIFAGLNSNNGTFYGQYVEKKTGLVLCKTGVAGISGGNGGPRSLNAIIFKGSPYFSGHEGSDATIGGYYASGGIGGGPAAGMDGKDGGDAYDLAGRAAPGLGGWGATPSVAGDTGEGYGQGGGGGHGGGGGGRGGIGGGGGKPFGGYGGNGGNGGKGGPGLIIIYY